MITKLEVHRAIFQKFGAVTDRVAISEPQKKHVAVKRFTSMGLGPKNMTPKPNFNSRGEVSVFLDKKNLIITVPEEISKKIIAQVLEKTELASTEVQFSEDSAEYSEAVQCLMYYIPIAVAGLKSKDGPTSFSGSMLYFDGEFIFDLYTACRLSELSLIDATLILRRPLLNRPAQVLHDFRETLSIPGVKECFKSNTKGNTLPEDEFQSWGNLQKMRSIYFRQIRESFKRFNTMALGFGISVFAWIALLFHINIFMVVFVLLLTFPVNYVLTQYFERKIIDVLKQCGELS